MADKFEVRKARIDKKLRANKEDYRFAKRSLKENFFEDAEEIEIAKILREHKNKDI